MLAISLLVGLAFGDDPDYLVPCGDVAADCESECKVNGECCDVESQIFEGGVWKCCLGKVTQENFVFTCHNPIEPPCEDSDDCDNFCMIDGECCEEDHVLTEDWANFYCCLGDVVEENMQFTCQEAAPKEMVCVGEIDSWMEDCLGIDNQADCEAKGVSIFSDGKCDWVEKPDCSAVTDPCMCTGFCGWSTSNNACGEYTEGETDCMECATLPMCKSGECAANACPAAYDKTMTCQCTAQCKQYENCCSDQDTCKVEQEDIVALCTAIKADGNCLDDCEYALDDAELSKLIPKWLVRDICMSDAGKYTVLCPETCECEGYIGVGDRWDCRAADKCVYRVEGTICLDKSCAINPNNGKPATRPVCDANPACYYDKDNNQCIDGPACDLKSGRFCTDPCYKSKSKECAEYPACEIRNWPLECVEAEECSWDGSTCSLKAD